jgi:hypothetical protein
MLPQCGVVVFDYSEWLNQYPEFAGVTVGQATSYFNRITYGGLVDNTPTSVIQDLFQRTILLNLAVSHMAYLFAPSANNGQARQLVGRISGATEGSVSVQTEYKIPTSDLEAWWNQSPYGSEYYAATSRFRTAFYVPPPYPRSSILGRFR